MNPMKPDWKLQKAAPYFERIRAVPENRVCKNLFLLLLIFWVYIFVTIAAEFACSFVAGIGLQFAGIPASEWKENADAGLLLQQFLTPVCIVMTFVCCRCIDNRPFRTMYLTRRKLLPDYLGGTLLGFAMMSMIVLAAWAGGALKFEGTAAGNSPVIMALLFLGWMIQGFSEELTCRGWLMTSVGTHHSVWFAVIVSAVNFALLHFSNNGFSAFAVVNLFLFGIVAALYVLKTGSLWGAAAMHSIWNWAQGNFFGMQVSGIGTGSTVLNFSQTGKAVWLGGGTFGLEAGAATTAVLIIAAVILLLIPQRSLQNEEEHTNGAI